MYSVIMGHLGSDAVAANSVVNIAKNLIVNLDEVVKIPAAIIHYKRYG